MLPGADETISRLTTLAHEAVIASWPRYELRRARASTSYPMLRGLGSADAGKHWCNVFAHRRELIRPGVSKIVTPNNDTLYSVAWLDLSDGPLVIDIPDMHGRYHVLGLIDGLTNPFAHLGSRLLTPGPHSVLVSGPGSREQEDHQWFGEQVRSPTRWVWVIGRILVSGAEDLPAVHKLQDGLRVRPYGNRRNAPSQFDPACDPAEPLDASHFCRQVNAALQEALGDDLTNTESALRFAEVGIGAGLSPTREQLHLLDAALVAVRRELQVPRAHRSPTNWEHLPMLGQAFDDDLLRAHVSHQYIGMVESREAVYPMTWRDSDGELLRGERDYALYFGPGDLPPVDAFWSLTLYDSATCRLVENPIERYAIGDRTSGLVRDAHGGLRILIGHRRPSRGEESNWLPAPPGEFYLCLRAYLPGAELLDGRYQVPSVQRIDN